jgi:hypothetical protein
MLILDRVKSLAITEEQQEPLYNEILRLNQLAAGLAFIYATVRSFEERGAAGEMRPSFSFGNDPNLPAPRPLILCMFHWYATSVCNLTRLIGLIAHETLLTGFEQRAAIIGYCQEVCGPVKVYRDKVAAHFARVAQHSSDNPADRAGSVIDDLTWITDRFWVGAMRLHVGGVPPSHHYAWSLTKFHEGQAARYLR